MSAISFFESIRDVSDVYSMSCPHGCNNCEPHFHRQMEILYVISGCNRVTINDESIILTDDQLAIADSFDVHSYKSLKDTSIRMIIPYSYLAPYIEAKNSKALSSNFILDSGIATQFKTIIMMIYDALQNQRNMVVDGLTNALLGLILAHIPLVEANKTKKMFINEILDYINDNFKNDLTLESVAKHFSYSKYYLSRLFNKFIGFHFEEYINGIRAENVITLIKYKKYSVTNAIMDSGFSSIPTFYRYFKQKYGCSIKHYVKQLSEQTERDDSIYRFAE